MNSFWIQILIGAVAILHSCSSEKRLIEYAAPWQPVAIPAAAPQLISIGNFDASNKAHLAQIAHHNAQILRQIKGLHPPVTQYHNPFPIYPSVNSPKHVMMPANSLNHHHVPYQQTTFQHHLAQSPVKHSFDKFPTTQNLISSSSNVAQTIMPHIPLKSYANSKPDMSQLKYFNSIGSTSKVPSVYLNAASGSSPSFQMFSTTSRVPFLRDITLSSPSSMFKSTQLPHPVANKYNTNNHMSFSGPRPASSNQIPGQIISSFSHFGPAVPQIIRGESKQRIRGNFLTSPFDHYHFGNPYSGQLTASGHFVAKNNFQNSLYFPHTGPGSYQLTNTFISNPQKPNSEALQFVNGPNSLTQNIQSPQTHAQAPHSSIQTQLPEPQPSYLPSLPTVPPSVLSPFFQVQQQQQEATSIPATQGQENQNVQNGLYTNSNNFHLLNDEYTINLVPPPPYKQSDPTRFRLRQPSTTTPSTPVPTSTYSPTHSVPVGPPSHDFFDEEQQKAMEILSKYNIPAISPLQDANRYSYNSGPFLDSISSTSETPSSSDDHVQQMWHSNANDTPTFTTEKPNMFRNLRRPSESEYQQHKLMHPAYTGVRRPLAPATTPFLPTSDSLNNAITHSFFTIEDAITLSPHLHYRRPVKPTNTNEIEANIRRPSNDIYTESADIDPFADIQKETETSGDIITLAPPSSTTAVQSPRPRNKLRRKRPRPTTENISNVNLNVNGDRIRFNSEVDDSNNESSTELPKNHKEYTINRDRGPPKQFSRETTSEAPRESTTSAYRNSNRVRNRTRQPSIGPAETHNEPSTQRPKRPNYSAEHRRPNNRFEDNKVQRQRPQAEKATGLPIEENEQTTIEQRDSYINLSRRPFTTQQAIPVSTTLQYAPTESREPEIEEFYVNTKFPSRTRNSSPSTVTRPPLITPTIENVKVIETTQYRNEENPVILSTKLNVNNEPSVSTGEPEINTFEEELKILEMQTHDIAPISSSSPLPSSSLPSATTISSSTTSEKLNLSKESMLTSDGPVYIKDEVKVEVSPHRNRQRMRNKEKILEAVAAATSSQTKAIPKDRGHSYAQLNEVTGAEIESSSTEKNSRLRVRLPVVYKAANKQNDEDDGQSTNATKSVRLSGSNKFDSKNRPRFSIKEYRQRMSSSTTTATPDFALSNDIVSTTASYTRLRFPTRQKNKTQEAISNTVIDDKPNIIFPEKQIETSSELNAESTRKRFVPKDRYSSRVKPTTELTSENQTVVSATPILEFPTAKPPLRRGSTRRDYLSNRTRYSTSTTSPSSIEPPVSRVPIIRNSSIPLRRPQTVSLRQRIQNHKKKESTATPLLVEDSLNDLAVEGTSEDKVSMSSNEVIPTSSSTEEYKHETAIMKIAKDDHSYRPHMHKDKLTTEKTNMAEVNEKENDLSDSPSQQSERVAELTIFGTNKFSSVNTGATSRRIPGYFTLATEDPILPIEAFFPQVKRN